MRKKLCIPRILKNISYILLPIFIAILGVLILALVYPMERSAIKQNLSYYETTTFAENYASELFNALSDINSFRDSNSSYYSRYVYTEYMEDSSDVKSINYFVQYYESNVAWLIIDNDTNEAYTNLSYSIETSSAGKIKNTIMKNQRYWTYENEKINTNINKLNNDNIDYIKSGINQKELILTEEGRYEENVNNAEKHSYTIYTAILDDLIYLDDISINKVVYSIILTINQKAVFLIPAIIILMMSLIPIIIIGVGRTNKKDGITLNWFDRILIEIAAIIAIIIGCIGGCFIASVSGISTMASFVLGLSVIGVGLVIIYLACILLFETVVKRLKTHTFIKTTFIYWAYKKISNFIKDIKETKKLIVFFILFIIANLICFGILWSDGFIGIVLSIALYAFTFTYLAKIVKSYIKVKDTVHELYKGNTEIDIDSRELVKDMQNMADELNNIAGGLSDAIEERLKSERLKTELITNVSHDIKTPLTSIINYVDLLKKEGMDSKKAAEYLEILDNKSQRLKKLTEDLVEASKASSGAIKLNMEKLNVNELIKQVSGEFEDKFKAHELEEVITFPEKEVYIKADSRYMYRVLENMYSNISKYAMEGTRVYTDILDKGSTISIELKNISKQKLNISADELMQRFVRGEASRNTEGSGLGLSIATSLTELQHGKFNIYLDGDLFKVKIEFEKEV